MTTARTLALAASCTLLAISLLGMFTDGQEPQMRAGSTTKPVIYTNKEP